jgi:hypothetical protein
VRASSEYESCWEALFSSLVRTFAGAQSLLAILSRNLGCFKNWKLNAEAGTVLVPRLLDLDHRLKFK